VFSGGWPRSAAGFHARLLHAQSLNRFRILAGHTLNGSRKTDCAAQANPAREQEEDLEIIEQLLALALEAVAKKTPDVRLADILKLLEFKHRLKPEVDARDIFWEWIERFRRDAAASPDGSDDSGDEDNRTADKQTTRKEEPIE